ncbi:MAG: ABC transporter permease [Nanoarchaeota archaeon]|nr:ABC transporter permease [Nanoarchaeota archaeon]
MKTFLLGAKYSMIDRWKAVRYFWLDYSAWIFVWPVVTFFMWYFLGKVVGSVSDIQDYGAFVITGTMTWTFMSRGFRKVQHKINQEFERKRLAYIYVTPSSRLGYFFGFSLFEFLRGLIDASILIFLMFLFGMNVNFNVLMLVLMFLLSWFSLIGMSYIFSGINLMLGRIEAITEVAFEMLRLVSGVFYPITVLPGFLQSFSKLLPPYYAVEGVRKVMLENATLIDVLPEISILFIFGVITLFLGSWMIKKGENQIKKEGLL